MKPAASTAVTRSFEVNLRPMASAAADTATVPRPAQRSTLSMIARHGRVFLPQASNESLKTSIYKANAGTAESKERKRFLVLENAEVT